MACKRSGVQIPLAPRQSPSSEGLLLFPRSAGSGNHQPPPVSPTAARRTLGGRGEGERHGGEDGTAASVVTQTGAGGADGDVRPGWGRGLLVDRSEDRGQGRGDHPGGSQPGRAQSRGGRAPGRGTVFVRESSGARLGGIPRRVVVW